MNNLPESEKAFIKYKGGRVRGEKVQYKDGIGYTIWTTFKDNDEDDTGCCFDFADENMNDVIKVCQEMAAAKADIYVPDEEYEKHEQKRKIKESKLWFKAWDLIDDVGITFTPFYWRFRSFFVVRPVPMGTTYVLKWCRGLFLGPITIVW